MTKTQFLCVVVLAILVIMTIGAVLIRIRTRRIAASRVGENFDTFVLSFTAQDAPLDVLRSVYSKFQDWCSDAVVAFPVRSNDVIGNIYGMADDDLVEIVLEVLTECGRELPPTEELHLLRPLVTIRDFVLLVATCPQKA